MRETKGKRNKLTLLILIAFFVVIAAVAAWKYFTAPATDSTTDANKESSNSQGSNNDDVVSEEKKDTPKESEATPEKQQVAPDSTVFSSLDIAPFDVTIYYSKGTGSFSYEVMKTSSGTPYVEFSAEDLIGTKCTGDKGVFASIIKNPSSADVPTLEATTKIGTDEYGLSLAGSNCTGDMTLLEDYQASFKTGFSSLRAYPPADA